MYPATTEAGNVRANDRYFPSQMSELCGLGLDAISGLFKTLSTRGCFVVELGPNHRVIRRVRHPARLQIDLDLGATRGEGRSGQNVIDTPTPVIAKRIPIIIPVGVLN